MYNPNRKSIFKFQEKFLDKGLLMKGKIFIKRKLKLRLKFKIIFPKLPKTTNLIRKNSKLIISLRILPGISLIYFNKLLSYLLNNKTIIKQIYKKYIPIKLKICFYNIKKIR